ncbi:hypothetical protein PIB30_010877 [Stylosanthes scabra]|uniref:Uncharacterized protein n=1 Tax=Stylosanthes scabra TaxID=79078 RepID=A0ABU6S5G6_9FABA|nr:hypothetical protein [Stylosanthes scabra]
MLYCFVCTTGILRKYNNIVYLIHHYPTYPLCLLRLKSLVQHQPIQNPASEELSIGKTLTMLGEIWPKIKDRNLSDREEAKSEETVENVIEVEEEERPNSSSSTFLSEEEAAIQIQSAFRSFLYISVKASKR